MSERIIYRIKKLFKIVKKGNYWEAYCPCCFWHGSANDCHGFGEIADSGDYEDGYCPKCGTDIEEHNSEYYNIFLIILHYTIGLIKGFSKKRFDKKESDRFCEYMDKEAREKGWY